MLHQKQFTMDVCHDTQSDTATCNLHREQVNTRKDWRDQWGEVADEKKSFLDNMWHKMRNTAGFNSSKQIPAVKKC